MANFRMTAARAGVPAAQADWRSTLARSGLAAKGVLYAVLGLLAIGVASGDASSGSASRSGAIETVASQPFGQWLLAILTVGLFALAFWHIIQAFTGDPVEGSDAGDRAKFAGKALIYLGTAVTALLILLPRLGGGTAAGGSGGTSDQATATVMTWPGGPWMVGVAGAAVIGAALAWAYRHVWNKAFMARLDRGDMSAEVKAGVERAGQAGYAARAIVAAIVGTFLIVAAVQHDPQEAVGLSGALGALAGETWGQAVLWVVAVGLFLYGCFCFAEAKYRRAV